MKKISYYLILLFILLVFTAACAGTDGMSAEDIAATSVYETVQVINQNATETALVPPTLTATEVPSSTPTVPPTNTPDSMPSTPTDTPVPAAGNDSAFPTYTPLPFIANTKYSTVRFVNSTGKQATVQLSGAQIYETTVGKSTIIKVRFDTYYFTIFIGKDGPYNGSIFINNADRYTVFIDEGNVRVATP